MFRQHGFACKTAAYQGKSNFIIDSKSLDHRKGPPKYHSNGSKGTLNFEGEGVGGFSSSNNLHAGWVTLTQKIQICADMLTGVVCRWRMAAAPGGAHAILHKSSMAYLLEVPDEKGAAHRMKRECCQRRKT